MTETSYTDALERRLLDAYASWQARYPDALGWRLLYSPRRVVDGARVAFIGFNPGGDFDNPAHGTFSCEAGSAYRPEIEDWGRSRALQGQVLALFARLGVAPEDVLAGNLVPFRSSREDSLPGKREAIAFGKTIWTELLERAGPEIVVSIGDTVNAEISDLLGVGPVQRVPVRWDRRTAKRGQFDGGTWVGLPHLSTYKIMNRPESQPALDELFAGLG